MKAALLSAIESLLNLWADYPGVGFACMAIAIIVAWRLLFLARIRIVQRPARHEMDDTEPTADAYTRARLDAVVRIDDARQRRRVS